MNILNKTKLKSLKSALLKRKSHLIIVYGPPGCLKTSTIRETCASLNLEIEYIDNILQYKSTIVMKNSIGLTDLDDFDFFVKNKTKISAFTNLIIETRCLPYMYKYIPSSICINISKLTNKQILKLLKDNHKCKLLSSDKTYNNDFNGKDINFDLIDGNLHRLTFYKFSHCIPSYSIYKYLNYIYGLSYNTSDNLENKPDDNKLLAKYISYNSVYLIDIEDLYGVYNAISLCEYRLIEFDEYLVYNVKKSLKKHVNGFYNFKIGQYLF